MKRRSTAELVAAMIVSIMAGPKIAKVILIDIGIDDHHTEFIRRHVGALRAAGLVRIAQWHGRWPMYGWQSEPFAKADEPAPIRVTPEKKAPRWHMTPERVPKPAPMPTRPNSVFHLGSAEGRL